MSVETMTESEIVTGLKEGAPEAFRALYVAQGRSVFSYLVRVTGRREMAEELTQETFLTAIRKIGFFKSRFDGGLRSWVFRIATHLAIDALRREKRIEFRSGETASREIESRAGTDPNPLEALEHGELGQKIDQAMQQLTESQRMIYLMHEHEEMSCFEISRVCGCSENGVKQKLFRARRALREALCE